MNTTKARSAKVPQEIADEKRCERVDVEMVSRKEFNAERDAQRERNEAMVERLVKVEIQCANSGEVVATIQALDKSMALLQQSVTSLSEEVKSLARQEEERDRREKERDVKLEQVDQKSKVDLITELKNHWFEIVVVIALALMTLERFIGDDKIAGYLQ